MKKKLLIGLAVVAALLVGWHVLATRISYTYQPAQLPATFDEFYKMKLAKSKEMKARPKNEERLVRYADKTPVALLYIHGYGASRAEGEFVLDKVAKELKANTYYLRLPGHGTNVEDQARATAKDHLDEVITTLRMMRKLGDKVVVVGTSMGGMIATYVAAEQPGLMDGLVLASPFYQFTSSSAKLTNFYPAFSLLKLFIERRPTSRPLPKGGDNWTLYWLTNQYFKSLKQLHELRRLTFNNGVLSKVTLPVLMLYVYKDEKTQDVTASVAEMLEAYGEFNNGTPNPLSRKVALEKGEHVVTSKYVDVPIEYDKVQKEITDFIRSLGKAK